MRYPGGKPTIGRVEVEQVRPGAHVRDVVHGDDLDIAEIKGPAHECGRSARNR